MGYAPLRVRAELDPAVLPGIRQALAGIARRNGIALVYSLPAVTADGRMADLRHAPGRATGDELLSYAKVHLFGPEERKAFCRRPRRPPRRGFPRASGPRW